jgi:hypothetical protein
LYKSYVLLKSSTFKPDGIYVAAVIGCMALGRGFCLHIYMDEVWG